MAEQSKVVCEMEESFAREDEEDCGLFYEGITEEVSCGGDS